MLRILEGDCRSTLAQIAPESVNCCVTSPPYFGLRDYGVTEQIGLEETPSAYVDQLVFLFREVRRVLRNDGTLWLNLGDSYANDAKWGGSSGGKHVKALHGNTGIGRGKKTTGLKPKDLMGIPWRVAFALQADGWYLRSDIIWAKPNCMPESVTDRPTRSHEYIFLLSKSERYFYDSEAIKEPGIYADITGMDITGFKDAEGFEGKHGRRISGGLTGGAYSPPGQTPHGNARKNKQRGHSRKHSGFNDRWDAMEKTEQCGGMRNKRDVWTVPLANYAEAHFATFPPDLIRPCILAGSPAGGTVLDPFGGSGTTGMVALQEGREAILCELNPEYVTLIRQRCETTVGLAL